MSYQHLVESKKKIAVLSFFVVLFLLIASAKAEIIEINTTCSVWDCESYLLVEECTGQPLDKVEKKFEKTADIKNIDAKAVKGSDNLLYVFGSIKGATQNKWSISIGNCILDPWWNSSWNYKMPLEVNQTGSSALTDFPIIVNGTFYIDTETLISAGKMNESCKDIRFINSNEDDELDFEFESHSDPTYGCNTTQTLVHLEVDSLPSTNTTVFMYYGNPTADFGNDTIGTWQSDYKMVLHFGEEGTDANITAQDSTGNDNDAYELVNTITSHNEAGIFGYAVGFPGNRAGLTVPSSSSFDVANDTGFLVEMWLFWNETALTNDDWIFARWGGAGAKQTIVLIEEVSAPSDIRFVISDDGTATGIQCDGGVAFPNNVWTYLAVGYNSTHALIYINGGLNKTCAYTGGVFNPTQDILIGGIGVDTHNANFGGKIDEIRWINNSMSDDYVKRSYEYGLSYFQAEEEADVTPPTYSDDSTNSTLAGTSVEHRLRWEDETDLSGYIFSFDNCTGSLANDTWQSFSTNPDWSNVTKTINETVGCEIRWCVYANDTSNNWNGTSCDVPFNYTTTEIPIPALICIQHYLEKNVYALICNVTSISHNQNYCRDNQTLVHNITYTINATDGQFETSEYCHYGCNNVSLECNPEPFQVNLWLIAGIFGFLIFLAVMLRLLKVI